MFRSYMYEFSNDKAIKIVEEKWHQITSTIDYPRSKLIIGIFEFEFQIFTDQSAEPEMKISSW